MSSVPEITVKGCWSPDQVSMCISMGETGQVNWSHIYIVQIPSLRADEIKLWLNQSLVIVCTQANKYLGTVEFHPLSLFSSCGR